MNLELVAQNYRYILKHQGTDRAEEYLSNIWLYRRYEFTKKLRPSLRKVFIERIKQIEINKDDI